MAELLNQDTKYYPSSLTPMKRWMQINKQRLHLCSNLHGAQRLLFTNSALSVWAYQKVSVFFLFFLFFFYKDRDFHCGSRCHTWEEQTRGNSLLKVMTSTTFPHQRFLFVYQSEDLFYDFTIKMRTVCTKRKETLLVFTFAEGYIYNKGLNLVHTKVSYALLMVRFRIIVRVKA